MKNYFAVATDTDEGSSMKKEKHRCHSASDYKQADNDQALETKGTTRAITMAFLQSD